MNPLWLLLIVPASATFGLFVAALMAVASRSSLIEDNMALREEIATLKNVNEQMRRLAELNSKSAADGTELQED